MTTIHAAALLLAICWTQPSSPAQDGTPVAPEEVLGHEVGADFHLATYDEALEYFEVLADTSPRVQLLEVGRSSFGAPWFVAFVSSAENLENLERYREISYQLAHPGDLSEETARSYSRTGKAIVHIDGGLHASESGHGQLGMQMAYNLVTGDGDPEIEAILDNVILMLWFSINPDGQNMLSSWYENNVGTPYEVSGYPGLYQKYVGHDNNRDGYMVNTLESRVITRTLRHWEPQVLYNHHHTAPFPTRIWIPPFAEPISANVHPLMFRTVNVIGMAMAHALEERGMPGATHMGTGFDDWYPGFMDHANNFHNVVSFLTETALYRYATPHFYPISDFPANRRDLRPGSLYPSPWRGGWWRISDAIDYMEVVSVAVLDYAAKYKTHLLYNRYQAGRDIIATHREEPPYGYIIPQQQRDPVAAVEMLRRLALNGIEVFELEQKATQSRIEYPAGTWVIPMDQPFALFVRQLFDVQTYPDLREFPEGPPDNPYDVAGWTLPYQMEVRVVEASEPLTDDFRAALKPVVGQAVAWDAPAAEGAAFDSPIGVGFGTDPIAAGIVPLPGKASGTGSALVIDPRQNNAFRALDLAWKASGVVRFRKADGENPGAYVITGVSESTWRPWIEDLAIQAERVNTDELPELSRARVGLFRPLAGNSDEGWTRWVLERFGIDFVPMFNADIRAGQLDERIDVLILASMGSGTILNGSANGSVPPRYAGGIGEVGVREIEQFVQAGGTLVCLGSSTGFAISQLHLPVENVTSGLSRTEYHASGSIHAVDVDLSHPVMWGMPATAKVLMDRSPVFTTTEGFEGTALAKYDETRSPLLSGYLLGEDHIKGFAAALDVKHGDGHVLLIGFRPQWRGQPFGTFRVLLNASLYSGALAEVEGDPDFWTAPEPEESDAEEEAENAPAEGRRGGRGGRGRGGRGRRGGPGR